MGAFLDALNDHSTIILTFAGVLSALAAIITAVIASKSLKAARDENTKRQQPMMIAELQQAENSESALDLRVRNVGLTAARNVKVTFDPVLDPDLAVEDKLSSYIIDRYAEPIPTIAPGQTLSNIWHSGGLVDNSTRLKNILNTPEVFTVRIEYTGLGGKALADEYRLSVHTITVETYSTSSRSLPGRLEAYEKCLKSIDASLKKISSSVDRS